MAVTDNAQTPYANIQGGATNGIFTSTYGSAIDLFYANHLPQVYKRFGNQFDDVSGGSELAVFPCCGDF